MADQISKDIKEATERVAGEGNVKIILTHTPPFSRDMLSEEAKLILNIWRKKQQEKENHLSITRQKWLSQKVKSYGVALKCLVS